MTLLMPSTVHASCILFSCLSSRRKTRLRWISGISRCPHRTQVQGCSVSSSSRTGSSSPSTWSTWSTTTASTETCTSTSTWGSSIWTRSLSCERRHRSRGKFNVMLEDRKKEREWTHLCGRSHAHLLSLFLQINSRSKDENA